MSKSKTARIIHFPIQGKNAGLSAPTVLDELKSALANAEPASTKAVSGVERRPVEPTVINGDGAQVINGDISITNNNTTYQVGSAPRPKIIVKTGDGVIDAAQKRRLLELRDSVVEASAAGAKPKTPGGVMLGLNRYMKVNTYAEILATDFDRAVKWLTRQRAIKTSLPSAKKKLPNWRNGRIKAIHSRCKERGWEAWRIAHMLKTFGKESMIDLSDDELEKLYRTVMGKK
jgi:hypothetical protein